MESQSAERPGFVSRIALAEACVRRARRDVPLEGLSSEGADPLQDHDPRGRRVHAPLLWTDCEPGDPRQSREGA